LYDNVFVAELYELILFVRLAGYPPFTNGLEEENIALLFEQILACDYKFDERYWQKISPEGIL
jgi:hypothetical protein